MESQTDSTVHASGFGSPPPGGGGFGPPQGGGGGFGPPQGGGGGFGPPPGGQPPGGFGPPPGGGGYGPPPGGQQQGGYGPPMGGEPPKKSKTGMYVGIGCAVLLFLGCLCGGGVYMFVIRPAQQAAEAFNTGLQNYQPTPGTFGTVPSTDSTGSGAAPSGSDTCAKVDRCCPAFYVARGLPAESASTTCAQMASARSQAMGAMLETVCAAQMQAFTSAGGGVPLPPECQ